jgi:hypothetical protein
MRRTQIMQTGLFVDGKPVVEKRKKKKINHGLCPNASGAVIQERKPTTRGQAHQAG